MANYTVRVELYGNATNETYNKLHDAMSANGYSKHLTENSIAYKLPTAEYITNSKQSLSAKQVLAEVKRVAATVWGDNGILVTETVSRWEYDNLKIG